MNIKYSLLKLKKQLLSNLKIVGYKLFLIFYGKIENFINFQDCDSAKKNIVKFDNDLIYYVYTVNNGRLYTDTIHDTAVIVNKKLLSEVSFQFRLFDKKIKNAKLSENKVFQNGTPRILKKVRGNVISLLTGGAGKNNYFHWLFDVLPRLGLYKKLFKIQDIDYFLIPDSSYSYQRESLKLLEIEKQKVLLSNEFRHIKFEKLFLTSHPYVFNNDPTFSITNIPKWIIDWLRQNFLSKVKGQQFESKKIFIGRKGISQTGRSIINNEEVMSFFKNKNYEIIFLEDMNFLEQINLFNNSKEIAGLHGAGFANIIFCKPNTKVLEIKPKFAGKAIENLSKTSKLNFECLEINPENSEKNQQGHIKVDINQLPKFI